MTPVGASKPDYRAAINRVPVLEAHVLSRAANPPTPEAAIAFDIVVAKILKMHQDANLPYQPSDDGFVFFKSRNRIVPWPRRTLAARH
jgi:hypothetical protein